MTYAVYVLALGIVPVLYVDGEALSVEFKLKTSPGLISESVPKSQPKVALYYWSDTDALIQFFTRRSA